jgi:hypothetical protein
MPNSPRVSKRYRAPDEPAQTVPNDADALAAAQKAPLVPARQARAPPRETSRDYVSGPIVVACSLLAKANGAGVAGSRRPQTAQAVRAQNVDRRAAHPVPSKLGRRAAARTRQPGESQIPRVPPHPAWQALAHREQRSPTNPFLPAQLNLPHLIARRGATCREPANVGQIVATVW